MVNIQNHISKVNFFPLKIMPKHFFNFLYDRLFPKFFSYIPLEYKTIRKTRLVFRFISVFFEWCRFSGNNIVFDREKDSYSLYFLTQKCKSWPCAFHRRLVKMLTSGQNRSHLAAAYFDGQGHRLFCC